MDTSTVDVMKSKTLRSIEQKMETVEPGSLRYNVLDAVKSFKASWIALGQILYSVYKDKIFKEWGYLTFEAYCKAELGLQKQTASKLLHSYYFLEKHEPQFLKDVQSQGTVNPKSIPTVDAVNVLRLVANNKELTEDDYQEFKKSVFEQGKEGKEVKKQVGLRLRSLREEEDPQKAREIRRISALKRLFSTAKTLQKELMHGNFITDKTAKELERFLACLQSEIGDADA
ncbi:MAG: hypothetical protein ABIC68_01670 [Candidatus Omnitrophota bacterium]